MGEEHGTMINKRFAIWIGLGLAGGCYAGVDDPEEESLHRTGGMCLRSGTSGASSRIRWDCTRNAELGDQDVIALGPTPTAGPTEDAILAGVDDMMDGVIADCLANPEFANSCTQACAAEGLTWQPPGLCEDEMDLVAEIVGPVFDDPEGGLCPDGSVAQGAVVQATAECVCECGPPLDPPPGPPQGPPQGPPPPPPPGS